MPLTRIQVPICPNPEIPLAQHTTANRFKLFCFDIGVLLRSLQIPGRTTLQQRIGTYRGYLLENFVAQELRAHLGTELYSWVGATSEVEFLVQLDDGVVPVEVKSSSRSRRARSLQACTDKYTPSRAVKVTGQELRPCRSVGGTAAVCVTAPEAHLTCHRELVRIWWAKAMEGACQKN